MKGSTLTSTATGPTLVKGTRMAMSSSGTTMVGVARVRSLGERPSGSAGGGGGTRRRTLTRVGPSISTPVARSVKVTSIPYQPWGRPLVSTDRGMAWRTPMVAVGLARSVFITTPLVESTMSTRTPKGKA